MQIKKIVSVVSVVILAVLLCIAYANKEDVGQSLKTGYQDLNIKAETFVNYKKASESDFESISEDGRVYWKYVGDDRLVRVPEKIKGEKVTSTYKMFSGNTDIVGVILPESATDIESTCELATSLNEVAGWSSKLTNMDSAFYGCYNLKTVSELPDTVTNMNMTFAGCNSLTEICEELPKNVTNIDGAFMESGIMSVPKFNEKLETAEAAFENCNNIQVAIVKDTGNNLESIKEMFYGCQGLESAHIYIPESVEDYSMLFEDSTVKEVYIASNLELSPKDFTFEYINISKEFN